VPSSGALPDVRTIFPSQSSQRSRGFHKPAVSGAAPETATIYASKQQPADRFCKAILPEQHRLEDPIYLLA
jgi:hypothetical protein